MKRFIAALTVVLAVVLAGCLAGCGQGSSAKASGSSSKATSGASKVAELPDRNGFDEATNQTVDVLGVQFSLPTYYEESPSDGKKILYKAQNVDGKSDGVSAGFIGREPYTTAASVEKFQSNKDTVALSAFKADAFKDMRIVDSADGGIADLPSGVYTIAGRYVSGNNSTNIVVRMGIFLNPNLEVGIAFLMQPDTATYNYIPDFNKVLASATVVEQPPAEEAPAEEVSDEVSPDLREVLDSYEAFMDEYIDFMQKYKDSDDITGMMNDYMTYMQKYSNLVSKINAMDTNKMSAADAAYYLEVTARVSQKLLNAAV